MGSRGESSQGWGRGKGGKGERVKGARLFGFKSAVYSL